MKIIKIVAVLLSVVMCLLWAVSCSSGKNTSGTGAVPSPSGQSSVQSPTPASPGTSTESLPASKPALISTPTPDGPADPAVVLKGKSALFCGDSITMASTYDTVHKWWGWAGRIHEQYKLSSYKNAGVDGASVSNCRDENIVLRQVNNNKGTKYDFVVLHGGVNDAWDVAPVGAMVEATPEETKISDLDLSTFAGGLENLLYYTKQYYPDATICYIINFRIYSSIGSLGKMEEYVEQTRKICDKWGVPYLDLYDNKTFEREFLNDTSKNLADKIHPNSKGYDILARYIAQFMADICPKD